MKIVTVFGFVIRGWRYELLRLRFNDCLGDEFMFFRYRDYFWRMNK